MPGACDAWLGELYCCFLSSPLTVAPACIQNRLVESLIDAMAPPTSYHMALSVLIPLPFVIVSTILRFWIRSKRKAWGPDDWAMVINLVSSVLNNT